MEGIHTVDDVFAEVKKIQLDNLANAKDNPIVLFTLDSVEEGVGVRTVPDKVLLGLVDMQDESQHKAIIINDNVLVSTNDMFVVSEDDKDGSLCIGGSILIDKKEYQYNELDLDAPDN